MSADFKCFIGLHKYEVYKEVSLETKSGIELNKVIISRCTNCGKIHKDYIDFQRAF